MPASLASELAALEARALRRRLREVSSPQQILVEIAGREFVNFSSNDYLGLATEPALRDAAKRAIDRYGTGSGASRLVCGSLSPHVRLEERLAEFKRAEAALTFSSGYAAAVGTLAALAGRDDVLILDKLCHASLLDGARLSGAHLRIFPHNHLGKLESHLRWARAHFPEARIIVVTESVFSMDGDRAALAEIVEIKARYGAMLMLDEAHAVGVIGRHGRGLAEHLGLNAAVEIQMGTLSKAIGNSGGYICGNRVLIDLLSNRARSFIYSTAPPPAVAAASEAAVEFLMSPAGEERRQLLVKNIAQFSRELSAATGEERKLQSGIVPLVLGSSESALEGAQTLMDKGFLVPAIRFPTVARDAARLRVTLCALHTSEQISALIQALPR